MKRSCFVLEHCSQDSGVSQAVGSMRETCGVFWRLRRGGPDDVVKPPPKAEDLRHMYFLCEEASTLPERVSNIVKGDDVAGKHL
jgi:hypothetical protein